jgi:hypothetical protein
VNKLKRMRLTEHVAFIGKMRTVYKIWIENLKVRDYLEDPDIDMRIILK